MNYYDVIDQIKACFELDDEVATITHGNITEVDLENTNIYPLVHMTPTGVSPNERVKTYSFNIVVMSILDWVTGTESPNTDGIWYGVGSEQDVLSQMLYISERACNRLRRSATFRNQNMVLDSYPTMQPFIGDYNNGCAGWTFTLNIQTPSGDVDNGIC